MPKKKKSKRNPKPSRKPKLTKESKTNEVEDPITNRDVYRIRDGISQCKDIRGNDNNSVKAFAYALARSSKIIAREIRELEKYIKENFVDIKKFEKYQEGRRKLETEYKTHLIPLGIVLPKGYLERIGNLEKKNEKLIEQYLEFENEILEIESQIVFFKVKYSNVPENISAAQISGILELVDYDE